MQSTPIITANYLRRCVPGEVQVSTEELATSRQFHRLQAILSQNGEEKIRAFGTFASEKNECVLEGYEKPAAEFAQLKDCLPVPELPKYTLFEMRFSDAFYYLWSPGGGWGDLGRK